MIAMAIKQPIDQVKIAGTATSGTNSQFAGDGRFGPCRKGRSFLMPDMHPVDLAKSSEAVIQSVEAVARNAPDTLNTRFGQGLSQKIRNSHTHGYFTLLSASRKWEPVFGLRCA